MMSSRNQDQHNPPNRTKADRPQADKDRRGQGRAQGRQQEAQMPGQKGGQQQGGQHNANAKEQRRDPR